MKEYRYPKPGNSNCMGRYLESDELSEWFKQIHAIRNNEKPKKIPLPDPPHDWLRRLLKQP